MAGNPATEEYNAAGNTDSSRRTVELLLVGWPTAVRNDYKNALRIRWPTSGSI